MPTQEITLKDWLAQYGITPVLRSHGPEDITMLFTTHKQGESFDRCLLNYCPSGKGNYNTLYLASIGIENMEEQLGSLLRTLNSPKTSFLKSDERIIRDRNLPASPDLDHYEARITPSSLKEIIAPKDMDHFISISVHYLTPKDMVTYLSGGFPQLQTLPWKWNQTSPPFGHDKQAWHKSQQGHIAEAIRHCPVMRRKRHESLAVTSTEDMDTSLELV